MIAEFLRCVAAVLVLAGSGFSLLGAVGVLRLPDLYTRQHAATIAGVVGTGLTLLAMAVAGLDGTTAFRVIAGIAFLMLTTPISAHLLARAAYFAGQRPMTGAQTDEMNSDTDNRL